MALPFGWQRKAFLVLNTPFTLLGTPILLLLTPVYLLAGMLRLPLAVILLLFSVAWSGLLLVILSIERLSIFHVPALEILSFALAAPFLVVAHLLVSIAPSPTEEDAQEKYKKWAIIESFPNCAGVIKLLAERDQT